MLIRFAVKSDFIWQMLSGTGYDRHNRACHCIFGGNICHVTSHESPRLLEDLSYKCFWRWLDWRLLGSAKKTRRGKKPIGNGCVLTNRLFDVKHIAFDLRKGGLRDAEVYQEAVTMHRLIITFNGKDFKTFAANSKETGIIFVSQNLPDEQIDTKLVALLVRSTPKALFGKFTVLTGET